MCSIMIIFTSKAAFLFRKDPSGEESKLIKYLTEIDYNLPPHEGTILSKFQVSFTICFRKRKNEKSEEI